MELGHNESSERLQYRVFRWVEMWVDVGRDVTVKVIACDLHNVHNPQTIQQALVPCLWGWGGNCGRVSHQDTNFIIG